ncbi:hypothetical protein [Alkalihalophilus marmarensis]|uniref:hypothetical protein n=1 Tax=Alkalihalophilus marmarensis TaxID=521377 RepID=UPI002DB96E4F|nr:hypothetical protein [Alkalihalophilus marmarensis]MEC2073742.1 hypothetical protein [Alkalihalophilus marmarensis]
MKEKDLDLKKNLNEDVFEMIQRYEEAGKTKEEFLEDLNVIYQEFLKENKNNEFKKPL